MLRRIRNYMFAGDSDNCSESLQPRTKYGEFPYVKLACETTYNAYVALRALAITWRGNKYEASSRWYLKYPSDLYYIAVSWDRTLVISQSPSILHYSERIKEKFRIFNRLGSEGSSCEPGPLYNLISGTLIEFHSFSRGECFFWFPATTRFSVDTVVSRVNNFEAKSSKTHLTNRRNCSSF